MKWIFGYTVLVIIGFAFISCDDVVVVPPIEDNAIVLFDNYGIREMGPRLVPQHPELLMFREEYYNPDNPHDPAEDYTAYISTYNLNTGEITRLLGGNRYYGHGSVSPDATRMIYGYEGTLFLENYPPTGNPISLYESGILGGARWFANSDEIYYPIPQLYYPEIHKLNVNTLKYSVIYEEEEALGIGGFLSDDGKWFVYSKSILFDFDKLAWTQLFRWDGEQLVYERDLFDYTSGLLYPGPWSPDGSKFLVEGYRDFDNPLTYDTALFIYEVATGEVTQLTYTDRSRDMGIYSSCWSHDGSKVYFSTEERIFVIDVPE